MTHNMVGVNKMANADEGCGYLSCAVESKARNLKSTNAEKPILLVAYEQPEHVGDGFALVDIALFVAVACGLVIALWRRMSNR